MYNDHEDKSDIILDLEAAGFELAGHITVDSGQLLVCDPCYIESDWKSEEFDEENKSDSFSYNGCCHATLSKKQHGQLKFDKDHYGVGVAFSSGYGDGTYPVFVRKNADRVIVEVRIIME